MISIPYKIMDNASGRQAETIYEEIFTDYKLDKIPFSPGDVVVDVGAHVGVVSIWMAKHHPYTRIIAVEPSPANAESLIKNLEMNGVQNVSVVPMALTKDGRDVILRGRPSYNSGHLTIYGEEQNEVNYNVPSTTLKKLKKQFDITDIKLLKMDCEGAEYELLNNEALEGVEWLVAEFHTPAPRGLENPELVQMCQAKLGAVRVHYKVVQI